MKVSSILCLCVIIFAVIFCVSLILDMKDPHCYIQELYVPALDLSRNRPTSNNIFNNSILINPCLFFDLALIKKDVLYGDINLTFSYGRNAIAKHVVPTFYQENGKTANIREVVESSGVPWEGLLKAVSNGSAVVFRVDLAVWPSYYDGEAHWYSKKKAMRVGADVEVDGSGMKVKKEDVRLHSAASQPGVGIFVLFLSLVLYSQHLFDTSPLEKRIRYMGGIQIKM